MDYPGFGRSQVDSNSGSSCVPCLVKDWKKEIVDEMMHFIRLVKSRYAEELPCFLVGNSIGGATALQCAVDGGSSLIKGAVLLCPAIRSDAHAFLQVPSISTVRSHSFSAGASHAGPSYCAGLGLEVGGRGWLQRYAWTLRQRPVRLGTCSRLRFLEPLRLFLDLGICIAVTGCISS